MFKYRWWMLGPVAVELTMNAGLWLSLGIHLSIKPLYVDIHFLWWILSIMTEARAKRIQGYEAMYEVD